MTEAMTEARVELTGECEGCGVPNGILTNHGDHFCSKCAGNIAQRDQAEQHLIAYLTAALGPWKDHWLARGLTPLACAYTLEGAANEVFEAMKQEGIAARDAAKEAERA